jgi:hypothetical protein
MFRYPASSQRATLRCWQHHRVPGDEINAGAHRRDAGKRRWRNDGFRSRANLLPPVSPRAPKRRFVAVQRYVWSRGKPEMLGARSKCRE